LQPARIKRGVAFVKSHSQWLEQNNISLVSQIEELEIINHDYLHTVIDFGAMVTGVIANNKISQKYIRFLG
jgi:hypothetical protein